MQMKYLVPIVVMFTVACSKNKPDKVFTNGHLKPFGQKEADCNSEKERAESDFSKNKITLYHFPGLCRPFRHEEEARQILSKYGIKFEFGEAGCLGGTSKMCYEQTMNRRIDRRFGAHFRDSILKEAKKLYIFRHPDQVYEFEEVDTIARYPGAKTYSASISKPSDDFHSTFNYPVHFIFLKKKVFSITSADFIITKNGEIEDLEVESDFENPKNAPYKSLVEKGVADFIRRTKWIPATIYGIRVNSKMRVIIEHN